MLLLPLTIRLRCAGSIIISRLISCRLTSCLLISRSTLVRTTFSNVCFMLFFCFFQSANRLVFGLIINFSLHRYVIPNALQNYLFSLTYLLPCWHIFFGLHLIWHEPLFCIVSSYFYVYHSPPLDGVPSRESRLPMSATCPVHGGVSPCSLAFTLYSLHFAPYTKKTPLIPYNFTLFLHFPCLV